MNLNTLLAKEGAIVADGAMGTMLLEEGTKGQSIEALNLSEPERVLRLHRTYIAKGAELISTNSFAANPLMLDHWGLAEKTAIINKEAVRLAKEAAQGSALVAASVGPLGRALSPWGTLSREAAWESFQLQLAALLEAEPDLMLLETFSDLAEVELALDVLEELNCTLPILVTMAFLPEGKTSLGVEPLEAAAALKKRGIQYFGANCGSGPQEMLKVMETLSQVKGLNLIAQPNAGRPQLIEGRSVFFASPDYFAQISRNLLELGVKLIGGCCGTTPRHIGAMAGARAAWQSAGRLVVEQKIPATPKAQEKKPLPLQRPGILQQIEAGFVKTVEIDPPKGVDLSAVIAGAELLKKGGIDLINIADSPMARVRMSPVAIAHVLEREVGVKSILHFTCRDRNLLGLQSELLGAAALGVENVLALTGDPPSIGNHPQATAVFDVNSEGLVRILASLNQGKDMMGNEIGSQTNFAIGVAVNPAAKDLDLEIERLQGKVAAGAHFAQTQPIYDLELLEHFLAKVEGIKLPILVGVLPLRNSRHTEFLYNEVPGIEIPLEIRQLMAQGDAKTQAQNGVEIARKFVSQLEGRVSGVYLMPPFGNYQTALEVLS